MTMWNSGFLGSAANWARSSLFALSLASLSPLMTGCGPDGPPTGADGISPLDPPDGGDTTIPPTPRNTFAECFPPNHALQILIDGEGVTFGDPPSTPATGGSVISIDRETLCFQGEACSGNPSEAPLFRARGRWASPPLELNVPDTPNYGTVLARASARLGGNPLTQLTRTGLTGSWADQFPEAADAAHLGMTWVLDGVFDPDGCGVDITLYGAYKDPSYGLSAPQDRVVLPIYAPRSDGLTYSAEANFSNESVVIAEGPLTASFRFESVGDETADRWSDPVEVAATGIGSGLDHLEMTLVSSPRGEAEPGDGGTGGSDGGTGGMDAGSDSGIPPLPPPDGGSGG